MRSVTERRTSPQVPCQDAVEKVPWAKEVAAMKIENLEELGTPVAVPDVFMVKIAMIKNAKIIEIKSPAPVEGEEEHD
jgi:hypothetical protein